MRVYPLVVEENTIFLIAHKDQSANFDRCVGYQTQDGKQCKFDDRISNTMYLSKGSAIEACDDNDSCGAIHDSNCAGSHFFLCGIDATFEDVFGQCILISTNQTAVTTGSVSVD